MKILSLLLFSLLISKSGCEHSNQDLKTAVIEYVAHSRGFYQKTTINNQEVWVSNDRSGNEKRNKIKISDTDWKALVKLFEKVDLEQLKTLKSPTQKRFYDGAAIANLNITYKEKIYESASFDHGFPPEQIKEIVEKINSFAKQNNDN
ncbi:hypothetical protein [Flavobacterium sp. UMI-01]|uniref:hypothetical protein n=1 Tax=Flavobacterium sp. UMI-01 TaxID=1441053 RepID=UPI001C7CD60F|nr:hypothetical protein [Flavobacterium sp. UMI-01]GIZ07886.1 hypothetical protein FUMI01_06130 [Flavobacterium sp. UMI-01]